MPEFKSTYNILKKQDEDEAFESKWFESNEIVLPPSKEWDYKRELTVEDVDYWEVLYERGGGVGVYAAWQPYAEFYMITTGLDFKNDARNINGHLYHDRVFETYYGPGAEHKVKQRAKELGILLLEQTTWVEDKDMWLHSNTSQPSNKIYFLK
jgi:hypothetical protein